MTIIRWRTQPQWERMMDQSLQNQKNTKRAELYNHVHAPLTNISKMADHYLLEMAVPGISKDAIEIKAEKEVLTIAFELSQNDSENVNAENYVRREFETVSFKRSFVLPENCDSERISAKSEQGILSVNIPFEDPEKNKVFRSIAVN